MDEPDFLYVTYIAAPPEKVWACLLEPEFTRRFFGYQYESDWKAGSPFRVLRPDGALESEGVVLESDFPRRLSFAWRVLYVEGKRRELSEVVATYVLEPKQGVVRLTVSEAHRKPVDPEFLEGAIQGWPLILSRIKTFLETGHDLNGK